MPALALPLTFQNSFWSQDYRRGLEVLYGKLEQGVAENEQIIGFIRARAHAENETATFLIRQGTARAKVGGFQRDEGATLLVAFRGLQLETAAQGEVHKAAAHELDTLVANPFEEWALRHERRLRSSRANLMDGHLSAYESAQENVLKLKEEYLAKTQRADEAEDDAKFAPNAEIADKYTSSPRLEGRDTRTPAKRTPSISDRIAQKLKDIQKKAQSSTPEVVFEDAKASDADEEVESTPKVDKGKGRADEPVVGSPELLASPPPLSPQLPPAQVPQAPPITTEANILKIADVSLPGSIVSDLLKRAAAEIPLRPVKFPIMGEYQDSFTGEEFVAWLKDAQTPFSESWDLAEEAARDMTEKEGLLRRLGEIGNSFEASDEAYYQFRAKAFSLDEERPKKVDRKGTLLSPNSFSPVADNLVKRSNTFVHLVQRAMHANDSEPVHVKARLDADAADKTYRIAVRSLDRERLGLEEHIEDNLKALQKWESERLNAVKTVLLQFQGTLSNIRNGYHPSLERSSTLIASYQPEADLMALIERYRTGPFRPMPRIYESISHDESDVVFGIDLRKWADGGWFEMQADEKKDRIPEVVTAILSALNQSYANIPDDMEKRKTWIYEVPLVATHRLRESINSVPPDTSIPSEMLIKFDAPVLANTFRLWALELDPPLCLYESWDEIRRLYPAVGAPKPDVQAGFQEHLRELQTVLQRLPRVHLLVLDAFFNHLQSLIKTTKVKEADDIYITKLALSMGRIILRPKMETEMSIQDRHPTLLFIDLLKHYEEILPFVIANKKRDSERKIPIRKRTAMVDMRLSRSRLSGGVDAKEALAAQLAARNPAMRPSSTAAIPVKNELPAPPMRENLDAAASHALHTANSSTANAIEPSPQPIAKDPISSRPVFKEPPPEINDDLPPIPKFAEPPSEGPIDVDAPSGSVVISPPTPQKQRSAAAEDDAPPMPKFVEPAPDVDDEITVEAPSPPLLSPASRSPISSGTQSPNEDRPGAALSRSSSGRYVGRSSGLTRAPRPLSSSGADTSIASAMKRFNRTSSPVGSVSPARSRDSSMTRSTSPRVSSPHAYIAGRKRGGKTVAGSFQTGRPVDSDAEADGTPE